LCVALCTIVAHNIAQNRPDNFPSYPLDNHHCSDDVYLREGGVYWSGTNRDVVWVEDSGGRRNHVLFGHLNPPREGGNFQGEGKGWPIVKYRDTVVSCAKTADPMENGDAVWDA